MKKSVKAIIIAAVVLTFAIVLAPIWNVADDGEKMHYGSVLEIVSIDVSPAGLYGKCGEISFKLFGRELLTHKGKNISDVRIDLGASEIVSEEDMQAAANIIISQIGGWDSVKHVFSIEYCGDEESMQNLDYCIELGKKPYTQCVVFKSDFFTANSAKSGGFNPNSRYSDWQWYLAKTEDGEWELLTWGY